MRQISEQVVTHLEATYDGAWVCVLGRKFTVNVVHEPGHFMRGSTEDCHVVVMKLREPASALAKHNKNKGTNNLV